MHQSSGTTSSLLLSATAMSLTGSAVIGNSLTIGSVLTSYTLSGTYLGLNGSAVLAGSLTTSGTVSSALAVVSNSLQGTSLTLSNSALIGGSCTVGSSVIAGTIVGTTLAISGSATAALAVVSNTLQGTTLSIINSASIANSLTVGSSVASYTISGTLLALNGNASVTGTVTAALHNGGAMSLTGGGQHRGQPGCRLCGLCLHPFGHLSHDQWELLYERHDHGCSAQRCCDELERRGCGRRQPGCRVCGVCPTPSRAPLFRLQELLVSVAQSQSVALSPSGPCCRYETSTAQSPCRPPRQHVHLQSYGTSSPTCFQQRPLRRWHRIHHLEWDPYFHCVLSGVCHHQREAMGDERRYG